MKGNSLGWWIKAWIHERRKARHNIDKWSFSCPSIAVSEAYFTAVYNTFGGGGLGTGVQGDENVNDANVSDGMDMDRQMPPVNLHPVIVGEIMGKKKTTGPLLS